MAEPFLKWAGGKRRLLDELRRRLPADYVERRHTEPFVGGGALFFAMEPEWADLWDINSELINAYAVLRDTSLKGSGGLLDALRTHARLHCHDETAHYYRVRSDFNLGVPAAAGIQRAADFIYLNRTCFNGLWRVNKQGAFNVPKGRYKNPKIVQDEILRHAARVVQGPNVRVCCGDFRDVPYDAHDFVYFDPPYVPASKTASFTAYGADGFGPEEQTQLAELFASLSEQGIPCMLSNSDTPLVREHYEDHRIEEVTVRRSISAKKSSRERVGEVIVRNY